MALRTAQKSCQSRQLHADESTMAARWVIRIENLTLPQFCSACVLVHLSQQVPEMLHRQNP